MTRLDRRALFTSGAAAALLAASGVSLDAAPRPGGRLRLAVPRDGSLERLARGAVFDGLTEIGPDGVLRPELAESWSGSADARRWRFDLREGVRLHDGGVLGIEDAAASVRAWEVPGLIRVEAERPRTLLLELASGDPDLPFHLAAPGRIIAPAGRIDVPLREAVGTGAYRPDSAQEGRHFRARKVEDHYKQGRAGWADSIEIIVIPDAAVRAEALRDGYVDVAALPAPEGLLERGEFRYHPSADDMALAARCGVGIPRTIGTRAALDDERIAERWWIA
ncbi:ABC transporter substrate-binding protein [Antarcticimicrobium luteum]|uniref:Peptide ABC transporter substrate-binding protein n=1 Tax=Antarcticimicrobium luteum TaxID=2547397 RepID=A0A4R5UYD7_9RHOB|nr:ABC transporter substrate-binding protein [Antarcticimicrobium luteum]TDK44403.1 peptide ABC transporter substrate-binding protein [Antarcticimicrobium luteum]